MPELTLEWHGEQEVETTRLCDSLEYGSLGKVAHTCNLGTLGGQGVRLAWETLQNPISI